MKLDRLFHVLVVMGGASLGCQAGDDDTGRRGDPAPDAQPQSDAGTTPRDGAAATVDAAPGQPCFCNVEVCCDRSVEPAQVVAGFECCWSTTCP